MVRSHVSAPAVYLKYFLDDPTIGRKGILQVHNKKTNKNHPISIDNIIEKNYYSENLEKQLSDNYESQYDNMMKNIDIPNKKIKSVSNIEFAIYMIEHFFARSKSSDQFYHNLIQNLPNPIENITSQDIRDYFVPEVSKRAAIIGVHNVGVFELEENIVNSDNPIVRVPTLFGSILYLPLTFNEIVCVSNSKNENDCIKIGKIMNQFSFTSKWFNYQQYKQSNVFTIYKNEEDLSFQ
jgi:hypothetical protein